MNVYGFFPSTYCLSSIESCLFLPTQHIVFNRRDFQASVFYSMRRKNCRIWIYMCFLFVYVCFLFIFLARISFEFLYFPYLFSFLIYLWLRVMSMHSQTLSLRLSVCVYNVHWILNCRYHIEMFRLRLDIYIILAWLSLNSRNHTILLVFYRHTKIYFCLWCVVEIHSNFKQCMSKPAMEQLNANRFHWRKYL